MSIGWVECRPAWDCGWSGTENVGSGSHSESSFKMLSSSDRLSLLLWSCAFWESGRKFVLLKTDQIASCSRSGKLDYTEAVWWLAHSFPWRRSGPWLLAIWSFCDCRSLRRTSPGRCRWATWFSSWSCHYCHLMGRLFQAHSRKELCGQVPASWKYQSRCWALVRAVSRGNV